MSKAVILIDYENTHISLAKNELECNTDKFYLFKELGAPYGDEIEVYPIAKWDNFIFQQKAFEEFGIATIPVFSTAKNSSDIKLTVECMRLAYEDNVDTFIILTGDGGYLPLINHLIDKLKKHVILYSVKGSTNGELIKRLGDKHQWIEEALKDYLQPLTKINPLYYEVVRAVHFGLKKGMSYISRGQLFKFIQSSDKVFGNLTDEEIGKLIDNTIFCRLIYEVQSPHPSKEGITIREIKINYDSIWIKCLNLN